MKELLFVMVNFRLHRSRFNVFFVTMRQRKASSIAGGRVS